jgi:PE family
MDHSDSFSFRPAEVGAATSRLAELTDRIRRVMQAEALNLTVTASARDEVSQRVAATLNEVHTSFTKASDHGGDQIQGIVASLGTHTRSVVAADEDSAL